MSVLCCGYAFKRRNTVAWALWRKLPMSTATEILSAILEKPTDITHVSSLVTADVFLLALSFATGTPFRSGGSWTLKSNPDGEEVAI